MGRMTPNCLVSPEDFGWLLAGLDIVTVEEIKKVEKRSAQAEDMYLDEAF